MVFSCFFCFFWGGRMEICMLSVLGRGVLGRGSINYNFFFFLGGGGGYATHGTGLLLPSLLACEGK